MNYDQLLFSELRLAAVTAGEAELSEEALVKAMTVNEELLNLGYTLSPADVVKLSRSADADGFVSRVREYIGEVKAKPMYPDFPGQVMELDEAVFRFHQLLHYLSTYGIEDITGMKVTRGWLPEMQDTEKTESDEALLSAKVLALIDASEKYAVPYGKILTKTERMTDKEQLIIAECCKNLTAEQLTSVTVTFKQNLLPVFNTLFTSELSREDKLACLHNICQHTGDVWKCMDYSLTRAGFHFRTSQKRLIVKLLESYSLEDFKGNLVLSNKKAERTLLMLKYIDFNEYTRKEGFRQAVAMLREGRIRSWESGVKFLVGRKMPEALDVYAERPGMMLRHLTYLMRSGYKAEDIFDKLFPEAEQLKTQTVVSLLNFFSRSDFEQAGSERLEEAHVIRNMMFPILGRRLSANETPLKGKKVYIDMPDFDLEQSSIRIGDKSSEGGYIRSGLAYRIPEAVKRIRFFVYWNDEERVDVDLHGTALRPDGERLNVGWNSNYKNGMMVFSGDITHSDAAEYIDIDLEAAAGEVDTVSVNINLFSGYPTFREVDVCFVGAMAVEKTGADIQLYDPKNCFFVHYLTGDYRKINYGYVDVKNRVIVFDGLENSDRSYYSEMVRDNGFTAKEYLDILFKSQGAEAVSSKEEAEAVLIMGKPSAENEISLIDNNFFF